MGTSELMEMFTLEGDDKPAMREPSKKKAKKWVNKERILPVFHIHFLHKYNYGSPVKFTSYFSYTSYSQSLMSFTGNHNYSSEQKCSILRVSSMLPKSFWWKSKGPRGLYACWRASDFTSYAKYQIFLLVTICPETEFDIQKARVERSNEFYDSRSSGNSSLTEEEKWNLVELWDESQYAEQFDVANFMRMAHS